MRPPARRPGRRTKDSADARAALMAAARARFAAHGYAGTTVRAIAADAQVDPALINHYFDGKRGLFLAVVALPADPREAVAQLDDVPIDELGEALVRLVLAIWEGEDGPRFVAAVRSAIGDGDTQLMHEMVTAVIFEPLAGRLAGQDDVPTRLALLASQMSGLLITRLVLRIEPIASMPPDQLAAWIGPNVQRYLTGSV